MYSHIAHTIFRLLQHSSAHVCDGFLGKLRQASVVVGCATSAVILCDAHSIFAWQAKPMDIGCLASITIYHLREVMHRVGSSLQLPWNMLGQACCRPLMGLSMKKERCWRRWSGQQMATSC